MLEVLEGVRSAFCRHALVSYDVRVCVGIRLGSAPLPIIVATVRTFKHVHVLSEWCRTVLPALDHSRGSLLATTMTPETVS